MNFDIFTERKRMKASLIHLFRKIGRASLAIGLQNSHSGNMACLFREPKGSLKLAITRSGSQKGDLEPDDILFIDMAGNRKKERGASSELVVHQKVLGLKGVGASFHAHARELTLMTLAFSKQKKKIKSFFPLDPLGLTYLISIPVISVKRAYGSPELARVVTSRLESFPVVAVHGHGLFSRGRTLMEAFFYAGLADFSARVWRLLESLKLPAEERMEKERKWRGKLFSPPSPYQPDWERKIKLFLEKNKLKEIDKTRNRLFLAQLSPFFTGSLSLREKEQIIYAFPASTPLEIKGPLNNFNLFSLPEDNEFFWHRLIYEKTSAVSIIRAFIAEAEALAWLFLTADGELRFFKPMDVEGRVLHPEVPVLAPPVEVAQFLKLLKKYELLIIRGGGVWAMSSLSLSQALHHLSSLKDSCHYFLGLKELNLI